MDPRAGGGTNGFGNAEALSMQENLAKSNTPLARPIQWWPVPVFWGPAAESGHRN